MQWYGFQKLRSFVVAFLKPYIAALIIMNRENVFTIWLKSPLHVLAIITATAFLLRLYQLGESFWLDEILHSTRHSVATYSHLLRTIISRPEAPLYRILMISWSRLFGENEIWARTPSLIFGILSIILTYRLAKVRCLEKTALLAAIIMCFSPVHIWYSQEGTAYSMASFFVLSAALTFDRLTREPETNWLYFSYLFFIWASVFTHYYCFFFVVSLTFTSFFLQKSTRNRLLLLHAAVTACFATVIYLKYVNNQLITGLGYLRPFTADQLWMLFFHWFLHGNSLWTVSPYASPIPFLRENPLLLAIQLAAFAIFINGLRQLSKEGKNLNSVMLLCSFFSPQAGLFALNLLGFKHLYIERYVFETLPFFYIILAYGAISIKLKSVRYLTALFVLMISITSYPAYLKKNNDVWTVYKPNPDWRSTAEFLAHQEEPGLRAHVLTATYHMGLQYYLNKIEAGRHFSLNYFTPGRLKQIVLEKKTVRFYLVKNLFWKGRFQSIYNRLEEDSRFFLEDTTAFKGIVLYTFSLRH